MKFTVFISAIAIVFLATACGDFTNASTAAALAGAQTTLTPVPAAPAGCRLTVAYIKGAAVNISEGSTGNATALSNTVWTWTEGGAPDQLTAMGGATKVKISQDCKWVAYLQSDELWIARVDHSEPPLALVSLSYLASMITGDAHIVNFQFDPASKILYFTVSVIGDNGGMDMFSVKLNTMQPVRFIGPGLGGNFTISPDSKCLTITRPNQLDIYCKGWRQPARAFPDFANECAFGAHAGPDIHWASDSTGFFVVLPACYGGILSGHLKLHFFSLVDFLADRAQPNPLVDFVGWTYDIVDIAPDGNCLVHLMETGDLADLHLVCKKGQDVPQSDEIYVSYPKKDIGFLGWSPNSQNFVFLMNSNSMPSVDFIRPLIADRLGMPRKLLYEHIPDATWTTVIPSSIRFVDQTRIIFTGRVLNNNANNAGLWMEPIWIFQAQPTGLSPIDVGPSTFIADYDFAPKP